MAPTNDLSRAIRGLKVLIADDNPSMVELLENALGSQGLKIAGRAKNGLEAVELFKQLSPDVVLLDIDMPGLSGIDALIQIRDHDPNAFVIMMTGVATKGRIRDARQFGASHFLRKPFRMDQLYRDLEEAFNVELAGSRPRRIESAFAEGPRLNDEFERSASSASKSSPSSPDPVPTSSLLGPVAPSADVDEWLEALLRRRQELLELRDSVAKRLMEVETQIRGASAARTGSGERDGD